MASSTQPTGAATGRTKHQGLFTPRTEPMVLPCDTIQRPGCPKKTIWQGPSKATNRPRLATLERLDRSWPVALLARVERCAVKRIGIGHPRAGLRRREGDANHASCAVVCPKHPQAIAHSRAHGPPHHLARHRRGTVHNDHRNALSLRVPLWPSVALGHWRRRTCPPHRPVRQSRAQRCC